MWLLDGILREMFPIGTLVVATLTTSLWREFLIPRDLSTGQGGKGNVTNGDTSSADAADYLTLEGAPFTT